MELKGPLLPEPHHVKRVGSETDEQPPDQPLSTRDHEVIRRWAANHAAEPSTGEATASGPASSLHVTDGGAGIRFNFPGASLFRPIDWNEWLSEFDRHALTFVFEEAPQGSAGAPRYRLVKTDAWRGTL